VAYFRKSSFAVGNTKENHTWYQISRYSKPKSSSGISNQN
jgi:hypothetical protein